MSKHTLYYTCNTPLENTNVAHTVNSRSLDQRRGNLGSIYCIAGIFLGYKLSRKDCRGRMHACDITIHEYKCLLNQRTTRKLYPRNNTCYEHMMYSLYGTLLHVANN